MSIPPPRLTPTLNRLGPMTTRYSKSTSMKPSSSSFSTATTRSGKHPTITPLRLEATAQAELPYKVKITQDERDHVRDPNFQDDKERSPDPVQLPVLSKKEMSNLKSGITGSQWGPPKNARRRGALAVANPPRVGTAPSQPPPPSIGPVQPPPPVSTASSTASRPPPTIYRVADGLVLRREKLDSLRKRNSKATRATAVPVASIEVKVPKWKKTKKSKSTNNNKENEDDEDEDEDDTSSDGAESTSSDDEVQQGQKLENEEGIWVIEEDEARKAIFAGMAQIVQQVQFIFHNWALDVVWAIGASGRWAQFFRFNRTTTPAVDYSTISNETDAAKGKNIILDHSPSGFQIKRRRVRSSWLSMTTGPTRKSLRCTGAVL
ncbi:hypothetical protein CPB85DRAFT_1539165 [Mucidula mucida]|nr:hypothetical protein CPB85DRAFT_1539165 [Mucidula mucida]